MHSNVTQLPRDIDLFPLPMHVTFAVQEPFEPYEVSDPKCEFHRFVPYGNREYSVIEVRQLNEAKQYVALHKTLDGSEIEHSFFRFPTEERAAAHAIVQARSHSRTGRLWTIEFEGRVYEHTIKAEPYLQQYMDSLMQRTDRY